MIRSQMRNYLAVKRMKGLQLLYNIGWSQYNPEVLHRSGGSQVSELAGFVETLCESVGAFRPTIQFGACQIKRGSPRMVESGKEL